MKQTDYTGYDVDMMTKIKLIDAGPEGSVEWELPITSYYSNMNNVMHGGAAGVLMGPESFCNFCQDRC
jgi:acyl-coenzyme A thioesterase 13